MPRVSAKEKIVESALRLFRQEGYLNTSVDEIIADAGVSKGSFYHAFKSKEILALEAIEHYLGHVSQVLRNGPHLEVDEPLERAIAYLQHTEAMATELWCDGCMMGNFTVDLARGHPAVRAKLKLLFVRMEEQLLQIFEPMVQATPCCCLDARQLSRQYLCTLQGAVVLGQAHGDITITQACIRNFRYLLEAMRDNTWFCSAAEDSTGS